MAISPTDREGSQEPTTPTRIGAGSFATVFASPGRPIAIKVAHAPDHAAQVEWEFSSLQALHATTQNDLDALFVVPRPLAYYDPLTQKLLESPHPLRIRAHFYPTRTVSSSNSVPLPLPLMCRLYFGKELRPSAFVNPTNFPLDAARYDLLQGGDDDIPPKNEVAAGMGEMLALIHWHAGYDARDVEFVMAGAPDSAAVRLYVIDFNQMRAFHRDEGDVSELVDAFCANDPYYPRPVPGEALYDSFKRGYIGACPSETRERAALFLQAIQARHAERHPPVSAAI
ncbi:hypothetical protein LXA43DRAFT_908313 [Ganoderma leucocontextum]|nr:hypothetical protein LXA43DRAFT_908313 [Ganoderma leucocontextum]